MSETNGVEADESPQLDKLAAALAKAQAAVAHADPSRTAAVTKDGTKRRKYATLADVMDAGRPALSANGLAVVQHPSGGEGGLVLTSWLLHESGQWMRSRLSVPYAASQAMSETQALGSAITYCRRYAYAAICGVAVEDDDAESTKGAEGGQESATEAAPLPTTFPPFGKGQGQPIAGAQVSELEWYAARMREGVVDPEKARFKGKNEAMLRAVEAELARQRGPALGPKPETITAPPPPPASRPLVVEVRSGETEETAKARAIYETACELIGRAQSLAQVDKVVKSAKGKVSDVDFGALEDKGWARKTELQHPAAIPEPGEDG